MKSILAIIGILLIIFAIIDFAGMFFGYDITGQSWTPLVFGGVGSLLLKFGTSDSGLILGSKIKLILI